jgi:hypothetical protein
LYRSPLHIIPREELPPSGTADEEFLLRLRKKLLLEFDLSDSVTISINGHEYSKDEVIRTIYLLQSDGEMAVHFFIYTNEKLLDFLEKEASPMRFEELGLKALPEPFEKELNPLLRDRIDLGLKKLFDEADFGTLLKTWEGLQQLPAQVFYGAMDSINTRLQVFAERINAHRPTGKTKPETEYGFLIQEEYINFLNALPSEYQEAIDKLVWSVYELLRQWEGQKDYNRDFALRVCELLQQVNCSQRVKLMIHFMYQRVKTDQILKNIPEQKQEQKGSSWVEFVVYGAIFVVALLLKVATGGSSGESNTSSPYYFNSQELERLQKNIESTNQALKAMEQLKNSTYLSNGYGARTGRVLVKNKTGSDLLLMVTRPGAFTTENLSILNGKTDTLNVSTEDVFIIYSLNSKHPEKLEKVLYRKYHIELKDPQARYNAPPVIRLDKKFLSAATFENDKVKFAPEEQDTLSTARK